MNDALRSEPLQMRDIDVTTRKSLVDRGELSEHAYHPEMKAIHEKNNRRMIEIVSGYGWPKQSEVGEDGVDAAWLIVQHAVLEPKFQEKCIELLKAAVDEGEALGWYLAYLQDRVLVQHGKPQIYGTQHGVKDGKVFPLPTLDPDNVNAKRARLGLWSQEEHTAHLQNDYDTIQLNKNRGAK